MGYVRFSVFLGVFIVLFSASYAWSQSSVLEIFEKAVPSYIEGLDTQEFIDESGVYTKKPFGDEGLEYEFRLPNDWQVSKSFGFSLSQNLMTDIGRFGGPVKFNKARSFIRIQAMELDYKTSIQEWFISNIFKSGYSIQGATVHSPFEIESLHVELKDGETTIVRARTFLKGTRIIQILYYLPQTSWNDEKSLQEQVIRSFKLLGQTSDQTIETYENNFFDVVSLRYPTTWELEKDAKQSLDQIEAEIINYAPLRIEGQERAVNGRFYLGLFSHFVSKSVEDEMTAHLDKVMSQGVVIQGLYKRKFKKLRMSEDFGPQRIEVYSVLDGRNPHVETELWLVGTSIDDHNAVFSLLTPSKAKHFDLWTQNVQVFRLILESMHASEAELF